MGCASSSSGVKNVENGANNSTKFSTTSTKDGSKSSKSSPASPVKGPRSVDKGRRHVSFGDEPLTLVSDEDTLEVARESRNLSQNVVQENFDKDIREFYSVSWRSELGSGVNGVVRLAKHRITGLSYAMKTLSKKFIKPEKYQALKDEIKIMQNIDHPHILRIHEYFETKEHIYLLSELCTGGELYTRLIKQTDSMYSEQVACRYVHTMLSAIAFLHAHGIVHRDLKLENFLFETEKENSSLKLIDFGLSRLVSGDEKLSGAVGSSYYVAPEVLSGKLYDAKCDIWSIGVITYMLLSGVPPFDGDSDSKIFKAVKNGSWSFTASFGNISPEAKNFIQRCLATDPLNRQSAREALKHPWFRMLTLTQTSKNVSENVITKILDFGNRNKMTKLCLEVVAYTMQSSQLEEIKKQFIKMDTSKSGQISFADLKLALGAYVEPSKIEEVFEEIDFTHTGYINYHEFIAAVISASTIKEENLKLTFDMLSHHSDHFTGKDLGDLLGSQGSQDEVDAVLASANLNRHQKIHYRTFKNLLDLRDGHDEVGGDTASDDSTGAPSKLASALNGFSTEDVFASGTRSSPAPRAAAKSPGNKSPSSRRKPPAGRSSTTMSPSKHVMTDLSNRSRSESSELPPSPYAQYAQAKAPAPSRLMAVQVVFDKSSSMRSLATTESIQSCASPSPSKEGNANDGSMAEALKEDSCVGTAAADGDWLGIVTAPIVGIASYFPSFGSNQ